MGNWQTPTEPASPGGGGLKHEHVIISQLFGGGGKGVFNLEACFPGKIWGFKLLSDTGKWI